MRFALKTTSREELIEVSHLLAKTLESVENTKPWIVHIDAAYDSGKSLIALGIDQALNPERYPAELPRNLEADIMLAPQWHEKKLSVVFQNFNLLQHEYTSEEVFNINNPRPFYYRDCIKILEELNAEARILIGSNLSAAAADFNFNAHDKLPERIDINIGVYKLWGEFNRKLVINVDREALIERISAIAHDYKSPFDPANLVAAAKESFRHVTTARGYHRF